MYAPFLIHAQKKSKKKEREREEARQTQSITFVVCTDAADTADVREE